MFAGTRIKQTKQTNDIAKLETRQTDYTNEFELPKTPNNVRAMKNLSLVGNISKIPYRKNTAMLFSSTGESLIRDGWAVVRETTDVYKVFIYDGNLEIFKAIENALLSDLDLSELDHFKDLQTVVSSWTNDEYRYILADYNGLATYRNGQNQIVANIDYLVPSVRVRYLWDKVFDAYGFTYSGSIFSTDAFQNLWMTYPKGINTGDNDVTVFDSDETGLYEQLFLNSGFLFFKAAYLVTFQSWSGAPILMEQDRYPTVVETGLYRITVSGTVNKFYPPSHPVSRLIIGKNAVGIEPNDVAPYGPDGIFENIQDGEPFEFTFTINLLALESLCFVVKSQIDDWYRLDTDTSTVNVEIVQLNPNNPDFGEAFIDFSISDFFKEVIHHFGLSLFKRKYQNHYDFLTMEERIETAEKVDWSDKYIRRLSESYVYGDYARLNILRHEYDDDKDSYNDGHITIDNVNLSPSKSLIKSKIYTPLEKPVNYLGRQSLIYKLFSKELDDSGGQLGYKYKSLSKRFHFMRSISYNNPSGIRIGSQQLEEETVKTDVQVESYIGLPNKDVVRERYAAIGQLLNRSKVIRVLMTLTEIDIANLDFKKKYYLTQEQSYFLLNKVVSYELGKPTVVEMVSLSPYDADISSETP